MIPVVCSHSLTGKASPSFHSVSPDSQQQVSYHVPPSWLLPLETYDTGKTVVPMFFLSSLKDMVNVCRPNVRRWLISYAKGKWVLGTFPKPWESVKKKSMNTFPTSHVPWFPRGKGSLFSLSVVWRVGTSLRSESVLPARVVAPTARSHILKGRRTALFRGVNSFRFEMESAKALWRFEAHGEYKRSNSIELRE